MDKDKMFVIVGYDDDFSFDHWRCADERVRNTLHMTGDNKTFSDNKSLSPMLEVACKVCVRTIGDCGCVEGKDYRAPCDTYGWLCFFEARLRHGSEAVDASSGNQDESPAGFATYFKPDGHGCRGLHPMTKATWDSLPVFADAFQMYTSLPRPEAAVIVPFDIGDADQGYHRGFLWVNQEQLRTYYYGDEERARDWLNHTADELHGVIESNVREVMWGRYDERGLIDYDTCDRSPGLIGCGDQVILDELPAEFHDKARIAITQHEPSECVYSQMEWHNKSINNAA